MPWAEAREVACARMRRRCLEANNSPANNSPADKSPVADNFPLTEKSPGSSEAPLGCDGREPPI